MPLTPRPHHAGRAPTARTRPHPRRPSPVRLLAAGAALTLLATMTAACGGARPAGQNANAGGEPSGKVGELLTVATTVSPQTLDPAKMVQNDHFFAAAAYAPLIIRRSDGSLAPGLATEWRYLNDDNTAMELRLRPGVKFSDGSELTAQGVVDHFEYVQSSGGQYVPLLAGHTFTAKDPLTVVVKMSKPNPDLPHLLTQHQIIGGVISPIGLKEKKKLGTETHGAGPYMLDPAQTVAGDHYTYVPNPHFYDKGSVHWKKLVIRVMNNPQAVLNAMKTGQADFAQGDNSTLRAARQAGLTVTLTPLLWTGVTLADRDGTMAKPLADVRVRQALNYATDRKAITTALFADNGVPTAQPTAPGGDGYDASLDGLYPYDVDKAKQLLTEAGYGDGFDLAIVTARFASMNLIAQALAQQWKKIGVNLRITDHANSNQYFSAAFGAKYPTFMTTFGHQPIWTEGPALFLPDALFNPFHSKDPELQKLYDAAAKATGAAKRQADREVKAYLVRQAWFVPIVASGLPFYASKKVTGSTVSPKSPLASLYEIQLAK